MLTRNRTRLSFTYLTFWEDTTFIFVTNSSVSTTRCKKEVSLVDFKDAAWSPLCPQSALPTRVRHRHVPEPPKLSLWFPETALLSMRTLKIETTYGLATKRHQGFPLLCLSFLLFCFFCLFVFLFASDFATH